jgi:hypothetical protein
MKKNTGNPIPHPIIARWLDERHGSIYVVGSILRDYDDDDDDADD